MKKYMVVLAIGMGAVATSAFAAENYCLTKEAGKQLNQSEGAFVGKQLKAKGFRMNAKDVKMKYDVKETTDSMGGPEFKCAGKVAVISKAVSEPVFFYDIRYKVFMDEGYVGIDKKNISRSNIEFQSFL